jgi:hypothetical protein
MIAGLGDYEGHAGESPDGSVASLLKSDAAVRPEDGGGPALNDEPASSDVSDAAVASDGVWFIPDDAGLSPDVNIQCDTTTCAGCCSKGECVGGQSVATCGVVGAACKDCTSMGGACSNGACATKVPDAGSSKTCTVSKCGGCILFYQTSCCKSDQTCGCVVAFSGGSCK